MSARRTLARYWFAPQPVTDLALVRIGVVLVLLLRLPSLAGARTLGLDGPRLVGNVLPVVRLAMLPLGRLGQWDLRVLGPLIWSLTLASGLLALVGLRARLSVGIFAWANLVLYGLIYSRTGSLYHNNALAVIALGLLACVPCGAAWSVDAWRARRAGTRVPVASPDARWPLVTILWLFAITYFSAAMSKLVAGGVAWFAPSTIQYYLVEDGLLHHIPLAFAAAQFPALAAASALFAVVYESLFWTGLIWRRALPFLLLGGIVMHCGIYVLQRANFLEYAFLALVFVDPIRRFVLDWAAARSTNSTWSVLYDGLCPRCRRTRDVVRRFDPGRQLEWIDFEGDSVRAAAVAPGIGADALRNAMHVVTPTGQVVAGYDAFREIARALPLLAPARLVFALPTAEFVGPRVYARIAATRPRDVPCRDGVCEVPGPASR